MQLGPAGVISWLNSLLFHSTCNFRMKCAKLATYFGTIILIQCVVRKMTGLSFSKLERWALAKTEVSRPMSILLV